VCWHVRSAGRRVPHRVRNLHARADPHVARYSLRLSPAGGLPALVKSGAIAVWPTDFSPPKNSHLQQLLNQLPPKNICNAAYSFSPAAALHRSSFFIKPATCLPASSMSVSPLVSRPPPWVCRRRSPRQAHPRVLVKPHRRPPRWASYGHHRRAHHTWNGVTSLESLGRRENSEERGPLEPK
jgi:hypothetical protein